MYRSSAFRLTGVRRLAALLMLATAAACGDDPTGSVSRPTPQPGPQGPPAVASVEIDPGSVQIPIQGSRSLSAKLRAQTGVVLTGRLISWSSSDPTVVRVDENGNVTALKVGTAIVTAASEGRQGQSAIEVLPPPPVALVTIAGGGVDIEPGQRYYLSATVRAADGTVLTDRYLTWTTSDSLVARAYPDGSVLGIRGGTVTVTASVEGKSSSVSLRIPEWLQFALGKVDAQGLPAVISVAADTTERTEFATVVRERRERMIWGRLWLSTTDLRYRQRYELQTWERMVTYMNGNAIFGAEQLVGSRTILDEGAATEYDMWSGEPIYKSTAFAGYSFVPQRTETPGRVVDQSLPGGGFQRYVLTFTK